MNVDGTSWLLEVHSSSLMDNSMPFLVWIVFLIYVFKSNMGT